MTTRKSTTAGFSSVRDILDATGDSVLHRAQWLESVNQRFVALLPPALQHHIRVANIRERILFVLVETPAWHAKMRFHQQTLLDVAQKTGLDVREIRVRVAPPPAPNGQVMPTSTPWPPHVALAIERALRPREDPEPGSNNPSD